MASALFRFHPIIEIHHGRRMILRTLRLYLLGLMSLLFVGCESGPKLPPTVPAEGIVTLDGTPVADATVVFIADKGNYNATGVTNKDGKFAMKAFDSKSGAVVGSYKVELNKTVVETKGAGGGGESEVNLKFGLPKKYGTFTTSKLTIDLPEGGKKDITFDLKSK